MCKFAMLLGNHTVINGWWSVYLQNIRFFLKNRHNAV